jgi:hypothetical protein
MSVRTINAVSLKGMEWNMWNGMEPFEWDQPMVFRRNGGKTEKDENDRFAGQRQYFAEIMDGPEGILGDILTDIWTKEGTTEDNPKWGK